LEADQARLAQRPRDTAADRDEAAAARDPEVGRPVAGQPVRAVRGRRDDDVRGRRSSAEPDARRNQRDQPPPHEPQFLAASVQQSGRRIEGVILVTGGTGFVGPRVVRALRERDLPVRALVRRPSDGSATTLAAWGAELVQGDMTDAQSLRPAVDGADAVVHLVAIRQGSAEEFRRVMEGGTRELVAAARRRGCGASS
jgi:hypothetical protein